MTSLLPLEQLLVFRLVCLTVGVGVESGDTSFSKRLLRTCKSLAGFVLGKYYLNLAKRLRRSRDKFSERLELSAMPCWADGPTFSS